MVLRILACGVLGYLLGCANGALVISRLFLHDDVRKKGSGNAGLTNFLRSYGGWITLLVIAVDMGKMVAACLLAPLILPEYPVFAKMLGGVFVQLGHIFPVFFRFRGGKGILCSAALALMMDWRIFVIIIGIFLLIFLTTKLVSLGSILAALAYSLCFFLFFRGEPGVWVLGIFMAALAIFMHRSNIARLLRGEERKTYLHKSKNK